MRRLRDIQAFGRVGLPPGLDRLFTGDASATAQGSTAQAVPEPAGVALLTAGLALVASVARRRAGTPHPETLEQVDFVSRWSEVMMRKVSPKSGA